MFFSSFFVLAALSLLSEAGPLQQQLIASQVQVVAVSANTETRPLVMAYYPDWVSSSFPPEKIDFARFDWIDFAFAVPDQNYALSWDDPDSSPDLLHRLVTTAHSNGKKAKLSIGGWSGSQYFSSAVSTNSSRQVFANNILSAYNTFGLDGIDIDWEYPGLQGNPGNEINSDDSANFLSFLQLLRTVLPPSAKITAAAQLFPFAGEDGTPMKDVSAFAHVLDWVLLMNYDVWSSSSDPGPNAPMYNACQNSSQPDSNAVAAFTAWTAAGFPPSQLVLGVPSYGYLSNTNASDLRTRSASGSSNSSSDSSSVTPVVRISDSDGSGQVQFRDLVASGALVLSSDGSSFVGGGGFIREWDACSKTPFLRSPSADQVMAYDDPESLGMKAAFVQRTGMLGVNMFDVHGDTDQWSLTDALINGFSM